MRRKKIRFSISESANHVCSDEMINHSIDILAIVIHRSARVTHKSLLFYSNSQNSRHIHEMKVFPIFKKMIKYTTAWQHQVLERRMNQYNSDNISHK